MKYKYLISLALFSICGQAADLQAIKDADILRVGVWSGTPPYGFVALDGDNYGFEVALARKMAEDLLGDSNKIDFIYLNTFDDRIDYLRDDKVDLVIATFTKTPEREKLVDFAKPYVKTQFGILSHKKAPISNLKELKGRSIGVGVNTSADQYFTKNYPDADLKRFDGNPETYKNFRDGNIEGVADDNNLLYPWAKDYPDLFVVELDHIGNIAYTAPAVKKGNKSLLEFVNAEIDKLRKDGTFQAAWNQYLLPAYGDKIKPEDVLVLE